MILINVSFDWYAGLLEDRFEVCKKNGWTGDADESLFPTFLGYLSDKKGMYGIISASVIAGLLGFLLQGMFDYVWYNYRVFLFYFIVIGVSVVVCMIDKESEVNELD